MTKFKYHLTIINEGMVMCEVSSNHFPFIEAMAVRHRVGYRLMFMKRLTNNCCQALKHGVDWDIQNERRINSSSTHWADKYK